jgi:hypothetical protein
VLKIHLPLGLVESISAMHRQARVQRNLSIVPDSAGECYLIREAAPYRGETVIRSVLEKGWSRGNPDNLDC